jgi:hypothetical protein
MTRIYDMQREANRLDAYASLKSDADTRVAANQALRQQATAAGTQLSEASAWLAPEVSAIGKAKIDAFIAAEPRLAPFTTSTTTPCRPSSTRPTRRRPSNGPWWPRPTPDCPRCSATCACAAACWA